VVYTVQRHVGRGDNRGEVPTVKVAKHLITKKGTGVKVKLHAFWMALHGFDCQLHPSCMDGVEWATSNTIMHGEQSAPSNNNNNNNNIYIYIYTYKQTKFNFISCKQPVLEVGKISEFMSVR
jgi:hypothetical protein